MTTAPLRLLCGLSLASLTACDGGRVGRPDLILITVDTLRASHTSLHGYDRETTPAIDTWARGGSVFERATSMSSWTLPSMHMLLTGEVRVENAGDVLAEQRTLAEVLREEGYLTGAVVSNALLDHEQGYDRGFDHYDVIPPPESFADTNGWTGEEVVRKGLAWLESLGEARERRPTFLLLHLYDPHPPFIPSIPVPFPPRDEAARAVQRGNMLRALPPPQRALLTDQAFESVTVNIREYDTEVLQADQGLGILFEALEREDAHANTLVVLTSDHGEGLWQRPPSKGEELKKGVLFPQLIYGHGTQLYTEQVHVPLVFRGPGIPAGVRREDQATLLDVVPTILARLGLPAAAWADGVDLFPAGGTLPERAVFTICSRWTAVTVDGRWRLHQPAAYRVERFGAESELYDLLADPLETAPIEDPERARRLEQLIESWRSAYGRGEGTSTGASEHHRRLLERMGYAGQIDPEGDGG